jgi:hypothetical protein
MRRFSEDHQMTDKKALKLALKALETELAVDMTNGAEVGEAAELMCEAITAIKQALAAPVQEPVAWMDALGDIYKHELWPDWNPPHTFLYATPPAAQRQWVGLTDEQIKAIDEMALTKNMAIVMTMAALKEKNT